MTETETANSQKNDKETIRALFTETIEFEAEDGRSSTLTSVTESIKAAVSGEKPPPGNTGSESYKAAALPAKRAQ